MKPSEQMEGVTNSKDLKEIENGVAAFIASAKALEVVDEDSRKVATERLTTISKGIKGMEKLRKQFVKPIKDSAKAIDTFFKEREAPLAEADTIYRGKIGAYLDEQDRLRRKAEAAEQKRHEAETTEAEKWGTKKPEAPVAIAPPPKMSATSPRKVLEIEVMNIHRVPSKYLVVSESAVKAAWKDGVRQIAGLKLTEKNALIVR